jgi:cation transporter-like permease
MDSSTGNENMGRNIFSSILTGLGHAIGGFLGGAVVTFLLIFIFFSLFGTFTEVGPMMAITFSPIVGVVIAMIVGIRSGIRTYKRLSEQK